MPNVAEFDKQSPSSLRTQYESPFGTPHGKMIKKKYPTLKKEKTVTATMIIRL
jgi:hypothetical protein